MRPRRTHVSNHCLSLPGGTEDNDLWVHVGEDEDGDTLMTSVWVPTKAERQAIADGKNIALTMLGSRHAPVIMEVTAVPIGKRPNDE